MFYLSILLNSSKIHFYTSKRHFLVYFSQFN
nr:MAG TPA: hypothetical protein [Caudoviricetes sp.]